MSIELKVPSVGESVTEVVIGEWRIAEGDAVERDDNLVELESEKATFDLPAPANGVITEILKQNGETARVGEVIARLDDSGKGAAKKPAEKRGSKEEEPAKKKSGKAAQKEEDESSARVMPAARRALEERGLHAGDVEATGPGGRLLKEDVQRHGKSKDKKDKDSEPPRKAPVRAVEGARTEESVPMTAIRRRIASRLVEAQQNAALLTTFNEIDMSAVAALRKEHRDAFVEKYKVKLGFMSFFVKATIEALKDVPQINAEIRDDNIVYRNYYDIGVAIGGGKGLVVPVVRNAERLSFAEIEQTIDDLSRRAQNNRLEPDELRGGTFTITNGGIYGSLLSTPIINPPQSGVLGMHAIQDRAVVRDGAIVVRPMMYVALTYDHRIVDGREAVTFLKRIKDVIEEPSRMLIEI